MYQYVIQKLNPATREWGTIFSSIDFNETLDEWNRLKKTFPDWPIKFVNVLDYRLP